MTTEEIMKAVKPVICQYLKCPASAQFPPDLISITGNDLTGYVVNGFVDSQNSYGAMLRSDFTACVMVVNKSIVVTSASVAEKVEKARKEAFGKSYFSALLWVFILGSIISVILFSIVELLY